MLLKMSIAADLQRWLEQLKCTYIQILGAPAGIVLHEDRAQAHTT